MRFENTDVWGFEHSIKGMRNPKNSWDKSDSFYETFFESDFEGFNLNHKLPKYIIGPKDLSLAQALIKGGTEHRKFLRQIMVSVDITAPLYWWKEFDTYKVGTVANSTSTMHKLASTPITMDCFEMGDFIGNCENEHLPYHYFNDFWGEIIIQLERLRNIYLESKDKRYWKELIRLLPESWLQTRTVTMNYENIRTMIHQRTNHKLTEWSKDFIEWAKTLPNSEELLFFNQNQSGE